MATVVTKTIKPAGGGDYTTLAACMTARGRDFVAADVQEDWVCYAGNAGPLTSFSAMTTDNTRYLRVLAAPEARHVGVWDTSRAHIYSALGDGILNPYNAVKILVEGLLIRTDSGSVSKYCAQIGGNVASPSRLVGCVLVHQNGATGLGAKSSTLYSEAINCISYGTGVHFDGAIASNCTAVSSGESGTIGFQYRYSHNYAKNCISQGCLDGFNGAFGAASDYNISDVASDAPGTNSKTGTVVFKDAANGDYHLASSDTVARGAGANLTASGITTDVDGDARPATGAWDVGADHWVAAAQVESGAALAQLMRLGGRAEGVAGAGSPAVATLPALSASASGSQGFSGDATARFRDISARATGTRSGAAATSLAALIERNRIHSDNAYIFLAEIALPSGTTLRLAADPQSWVWPNTDAAQGMLADPGDSVSFSLPSDGALTALVDSGFGGTVYLQRQTGATTWFTMATFATRATEELTGLVPGTYRLVAHSDFTGECNAVLAGAGSHVWQSFNFDFDSYREGEDARRATLQLKVSNANMAVMRHVEQLEDWRKANGRFPCTLRLLCVNTALLDEDTPTGEFWFEDQRISCPAPMDWVFFEVGSPNLWARTVPARRVIRNFCAWRTTDECPHIASCDHSLTNCRTIAATIDPGRTEHFGGVPFVGDGAHYA